MSRGHTSLARVKFVTWYDAYESSDRMVLPCPICRARNPIFHRTKRFNSLFFFCSILCIKYFLICKIKRYVIMFFLYIKIDFWHSRYGPVVAFIPDNISVHVHLLEDNDAIKNQRWLLSAGWFSTKTTRVFQRRSLLVYLCRFCRQRKVKTFSSCGAHFRRGYNIFSVQIATPTVCITRQMHKQISWPITWLQVFERGLESEPVGGEILFGLRGGGGGG